MNAKTTNDNLQAAREAMVETIRRHGVRAPRILEAMRRLPRHRFLPQRPRAPREAYEDRPLSIGHGQTISQPYIVAYMTEQLQVEPGDRVLDVGSGSGYQAAVLAAIGCEVCTIELIPELAAHTQRIIRELELPRIDARQGNGYDGWPDDGHFQGILAGCAPEGVPQPLIDQLAEGGRMILPVGGHAQRLVILKKQDGQIHRSDDLAVRFVPMREHPPG